MTRREALASAIGLASAPAAGQVIADSPPASIDPDGVRAGQVLVADGKGGVHWQDQRSYLPCAPRAGDTFLLQPEGIRFVFHDGAWSPQR